MRPRALAAWLLSVAALLAVAARPARADDGGVAGFASALSALRDDPRRASDRAEVDALSFAADRMPPSETRAEADLFLGELYVERFHDPARAVHHLERAEAGPDEATRATARRSLVGALVLAGRESDAAAAARASGDDALLARALRAVRRTRIHLASSAALVGFVVLAATSVVRRRRALARGQLMRFGRATAFVGAWIAIFGALLAHTRDDGDARPFVLFGLALVPLACAARAWGLVGARTPFARAGRAALAGGAVLGSAFLLVEAIAPRLLEGLGL